MQKITPCLWFNDRAEEAAHFYTSIFPNSTIGKTSRYDEASAAVSGQKAGTVLTTEFMLNGQNFMALNGGPLFTFSEAISFVIDCENQDEVDHYWNALTEGGAESQCGWLKDKFGMSWQIVPKELGVLLSDPDPKKSGAVMKAMLEMKKIEVQGLKDAYEQA